MFAQQRLLNVREQQQRLAETRVSQAHRQRIKAAGELRAAEQDLEMLTAKVRDATSIDILQIQQSVPGMRERIVRAGEHLSRCEMRLSEAREELRRITLAVESLDLLRVQRRQEHVKWQQAEQQKEVEFAVLRQWSRNSTRIIEEPDHD